MKTERARYGPLVAVAAFVVAVVAFIAAPPPVSDTGQAVLTSSTAPQTIANADISDETPVANGVSAQFNVVVVTIDTSPPNQIVASNNKNSNYTTSTRPILAPQYSTLAIANDKVTINPTAVSSANHATTLRKGDFGHESALTVDVAVYVVVEKALNNEVRNCSGAELATTFGVVVLENVA